MVRRTTVSKPSARDDERRRRFRSPETEIILERRIYTHTHAHGFIRVRVVIVSAEHIRTNETIRRQKILNRRYDGRLARKPCEDTRGREGRADRCGIVLLASRCTYINTIVLIVIVFRHYKCNLII